MGLTAPKAVLLACGILASATAAAAQGQPPLAAAPPPPEATNIGLCNAELASAAADVGNLVTALRRSDAIGKLLAQEIADLRKQIEDLKKPAEAPKEPQP